MSEPFSIKLAVPFPTDRLYNGYILSREAVESALKNIKNVPIRKMGKERDTVGLVESGYYENDTLKITGNLFENIDPITTEMIYDGRDNVLKIFEFAVLPKEHYKEIFE